MTLSNQPVRIDFASVPQDFIIAPAQALVKVNFDYEPTLMDGQIVLSHAKVEFLEGPDKNQIVPMRMHEFHSHYTVVPGGKQSDGSRLFADNLYLRTVNTLGSGALQFERLYDPQLALISKENNELAHTEQTPIHRPGGLSSHWSNEALEQGILSNVQDHFLISKPGERLTDTAIIGEGWEHNILYSTQDSVIVSQERFMQSIKEGSVSVIKGSPLDDTLHGNQALSVQALGEESLRIKQEFVNKAAEVLAKDIHALKSKVDAFDGDSFDTAHAMACKLYQDNNRAAVFGSFADIVGISACYGIAETLTDYAKNTSPTLKTKKKT